MKRQFLCALLLFGISNAAQAHFVWVVADGDKTKAKLFISEELTPGDVGIEMIAGTKLTLRHADTSEEPLALVKGRDAFDLALKGTDNRLVYGSVDLGLNVRGDKAHVLIYYPKAIIGNPHDVRLGKSGAPVELFPIGAPGGMKLRLLARGKPLANSEITVILPNSKQKVVKTDANGETEVFAEPGRYGAWARFWEPVGGERDGKKFEETRHYATLVFDSTPGTATPVATLPQGTASFGAVASDGWLYVYGGHIVATHSYSTAAVSGRFDRLNLSDRKTWESLAAGPSVQGMNLAVDGGKVYRVGGMTALNKPGTKSETVSIADAARFDPKTKTWEALPALPQPRSSHDIVSIGDTLYVVGGWQLRGLEKPVWHETMLTLDASSRTAEWKSIPQPFHRRALIAAAFEGKVYVLGGFDDDSNPLRDVSIFDPKTGNWSGGPNLPVAPLEAFAPAAVVHQGRLFVNTGDGGVYRLDESGARWEQVGESTPRVAHRAVSDGRDILVIGGAVNAEASDLIEAVAIPQAAKTAGKQKP